MQRPDVVIAPLSHSSSAAQTSPGRGSSHNSPTSILSSPATGSSGYTLPPLNQFMTLPSSFLASRFGSSVDNISTTRNQEAIVAMNRNRDVLSNGPTLDNLLNDEDDEWNAADHFVLPHLVHFEPRTAAIDPVPTPITEEIDLTVSSSEDEDTARNTTGDSDDVIEIIETSGVPQPTPLRRKRRRPEAITSANVVLRPKRQCSTDVVRSAESTNIGMRNNEMLQKFKSELKCTICLDVLEGITSTICGHIFCAGCIRQAIRANGKCPLCQRRLHLKDTHPLFF